MDTSCGGCIRDDLDMICNGLPWYRKVTLFKCTQQYYAISPNFISAKINDTQQHSNFKWCRDRHENFNPMINECSKNTINYVQD